MYRILYYTDRGLRNYQQDCLYIDGKVVQSESMGSPEYTEKDKDDILVAICDGMGGLSSGDIASRSVCESLGKLKIPFSVEGVYKALYRIQLDFMKLNIFNSGTTVAGVYMNGSKSIIFNAGDSRVYKITDREIIYLSHDHSYVQQLVDKGIISYREAFYSPYRHYVEFGIGDIFMEDWERGVKPYIKNDYLEKDQFYFICTDGVNDTLKDEEIFQILHPDPFKNAEDLIKELDRRKEDNYSFIILSYS
ncbi:MAG TPA: serine/threonine-protein phosphatase [Persephonella sp.]|uniref:PPM-type phosphatase domain-containing protein n=1 Tax=Persephonella marina (strain DSM 14350 / EX-H1) TaxID=123214 RepID=C0QQR0_PERMH|nr:MULTISPECIES: PP2C family serine/threonine-protein phosphatase [Persephonella]ACO04776.1 conserved hypothetical protein [Persephonella marina EX-H1]HCB68757.1 serine/threonine-protein phosphatase [Persephonella sp.]